MIAIYTVIIILIFSILITRIAAIALTHTGLSRETAKFQARSAFTGVGFTTSESERVVNHPLRRRILLLLMILGNAGIVTAVASLIIGFTGINEKNVWLKLVILISGVVILWYFANSRFIDRHLSNIISRILKKHSHLEISDYASLLHLSGEYRIVEIMIEGEHWLNGEKIKNTKLRKEGINILAIARKDGAYIGAPQPSTQINEGDNLIVYGRADAIQHLENRLKGYSGNKDHDEQVIKQKEIVKKEKTEDNTGDKK